jgi:hypothetical protein
VVGTGWWHGEAAETPSEPRVAGGARGGRAKDRAGEEGGRRHQRWGKRGGGKEVVPPASKNSVGQESLAPLNLIFVDFWPIFVFKIHQIIWKSTGF